MIPRNLPIIGLMMRRFPEILSSSPSCQHVSAESCRHPPHDAKISRNLAIIPLMSACFGRILPSLAYRSIFLRKHPIIRFMQEFSAKNIPARGYAPHVRRSVSYGVEVNGVPPATWTMLTLTSARKATLPNLTARTTMRSISARWDTWVDWSASTNFICG